ncbi:1-acyl-sn-glycerol-3-phosphate acyltransferase [Corynebacterium pollutisoli]|mgnify:FL=1|uniref:1-acyl-sn-glycerol-3-phosphate acyltransferase n=1 Tax=Corynebacterium pollutisoli TaxID=1610489 RepID=A0A1X7I4E6_9CORY|nr:lysophospholipid acyltransferase family protein [Corynebacterium pollutisoli]SMG08914.1 1-acyl-sn-glycerol-3-phosphate acyltransferase [Corynebacterium pollutisoli]
MEKKWYWLYKNVLIGPFLRVWNRPTIEGIEHIPAEGSAIIASTHQAVMDSFFFPALSPRNITFPAKSEYFTAPGLIGRLQKWFFTSIGQIPVERGAANAGDATLAAARTVLDRGDVLGIYPEGTRSPDGRIYKGRTGMARIALATDAPIVPLAMIGSRDANPIGTWIPRPRKVRMKVGEPIDGRAYVESLGIDPDSREAARPLTDHVMAVLTELSGQPYVDMYASEVKESLAAGRGWPQGAEPTLG